MNILFFTIDNISSFETRSIYMDLVNKFRRKKNFVTVISVCEKRDYASDIPNRFETDGGEVLKVFSPNVTKVSNFFMKGVSLVYLKHLYSKVAKQAMKKRKYDLVLYGSPPVTVYGAVELVKKKQDAYSYLLLKDIWPYDLLFGGVLNTKGWKGVAFKILKLMARKLYNVSDSIGCMSPANIKFLLENELELDKEKIEVNPNSVEPFGVELSEETIVNTRKKYGIPTDKVVFLYGGNLGIPQGIDFALDAVKEAKEVKEASFVFIGGGTSREQVERAAKSDEFGNLIFIPPLPKDDFDQLAYACDVGLVFLNHDCLAPNYPSRILSYMQASLPLLCATDTYTDVGKIALENNYGVWCESNDTDNFVSLVEYMINDENRNRMGKESKKFFLDNYTSDVSYEKIMKRYRQKCK